MRLFLICIAMLFAQQATAAVTINVLETGGNVEATLSGSLNLNAMLGLNSTSPAYNGYYASAGGMAFTSGDTQYYNISAGTWTPYGTGTFGNWDSSSGDAWAMFTNPVIGVPNGYVSGAPLSATATKNASTFAGLGFTPGTYVTILSNNQVTDTVTVVVGPNVVTPSISIVKTVGTEPGVCSGTSEITVSPGTTVYYCYTVTNTGNVTLNLHDLADDSLGTIFSGLNYALTPGSSVNTVAAGLSIPSVINTTTTNTATWTAFSAAGAQASATASATVIVEETGKAIPTLSEWGMILMSLMLAGSAFWVIRRRTS